MKKLLLTFVLFLISIAYVFSQDQITLSFSKNSSGELILTVQGHTSPVTVKIGDQQVVLYVEENKVNLTALGINELTEISVETTQTESKPVEAVEEVETSSGVEKSVDAQATAAPIPPVSPFISPNPPLSTPF